MISSVICSSIRTRSARVRARPSSSMTRPKISSIWRRTSTWLDRSSLGSRSWITRFWIRNLTSRNDSRTGPWVEQPARRCGAAGVWRPPPHRPPATGTLDALGQPRPSRDGCSRCASRETSVTPLRPLTAIVRRCHVIATRTATSSVRPCWLPARRRSSAGFAPTTAEARRRTSWDTCASRLDRKNGTPRLRAYTTLRPSETIVWSTRRPIECSTSATRMPSDESARLSTSRTLSDP